MILIEPRFQLNYALTDFLSVELLGEIKNQTTSQIIDLQQDFLGLDLHAGHHPQGGWILNGSRESQPEKPACYGFQTRRLRALRTPR